MNQLVIERAESRVKSLDSDKKEVIRDAAHFIPLRYFGMILGFFISIFSKRFLGPMYVGVWQMLDVVMNYSNHATLGTSEAAYRKIPFYVGKRDWKKVEQVQNDMFGITTTMAIIVSIGIATYAVVMRSQLEIYFFYGLLYLSVFILVKRVDDYYTTLLRAHKEMQLCGWQLLLRDILNLTFTFVLIMPFKLYGLMVGTLVSTLIGLAYVHFRVRYRFKPTLSWAGVKELLGMGLPLLLTGLFTATIRNMDRLLIAKYMGVGAVGLYAIALMVKNYALGFPNMFSNVLAPRMTEKFGERGSAQGIRNYLVRPLEMIGFLIAFTVGGLVLGAPPVIAWVLPNFTEGIPSMKIFLWGAYFSCLGSQARTFLVITNKYWQATVIAFFGMLVTFIVTLSFVKLGWGIEGVALGSVLSIILYNAALLGFAFKQFATMKDVTRFFMTSTSYFLYFFVLSLSLDNSIDGYQIFGFVIKIALYLALALPAFVLMNKKTGVITMIVDSLKKNRGSAQGNTA